MQLNINTVEPIGTYKFMRFFLNLLGKARDTTEKYNILVIIPELSTYFLRLVLEKAVVELACTLSDELDFIQKKFPAYFQ